jgi:hypothetical protein
MKISVLPFLRRVGLAGLSIGVLILGGSATWFSATAVDDQPVPPPPPAADRVTRSGSENLVIPASLATKIGLATEPAVKPTKNCDLPPIQARLAVDPVVMTRVHTRFAGEVVAVGLREEEMKGQPIRPWIKVKKGQLLAVVWSRDLGVIKSQLVDALTTLRTDEETLQRVEDLYKQNGGAERTVRDARQKVQSDKNAVATAERSLRTARLTDEEIEAVRTEAKRLADNGAAPTNLGDWSRVELRSPREGVIVEMNVSDGLMVDTATDLFKIADLSYLSIQAFVYDDDLALLAALPRPVKCTIAIPGRSGDPLAGTLDQFGSVMDTNQNTTVVGGRVDNPAGELKVGQFATVCVATPPPAGAVEVPTVAVVEDGRRSFLFVQRSETEFTRVNVHVLRRTRDRIFLRTDGDALHAGDRVVTTGALLLGEAMDGMSDPTKPAPADRK